jgi:uracil phosphoribosyltransferase
MSNVHVIDHPLVDHHLIRLRDKSTKPSEFRRLIRRLATLLAFQSTQDLRTQEAEVQTPVSVARGRRLAQRIAIVPILRAGLGMVDPIQDLIPDAEVWHLGLYRNETTAEPVEYYNRLPQDAASDVAPIDVALIVDPMLATGGSASLALEKLNEIGVANCKLISIISSQPGIDAVLERFPNSQIYTCAVDAELNSQKFIVPGLGDAGDRIFNT